MTLPRMRMTMRPAVAAVATTAILLGLASCVISLVSTSMEIAFADEQTAIFDQMRRQTADAVAVNVSYLEYTLSYYPSGTKQTKGSRLDRVVERARRCAMREIMGILRSRTGKDFGDDPRRWIDGLRASMARHGGRTPVPDLLVARTYDPSALFAAARRSVAALCVLGPPALARADGPDIHPRAEADSHPVHGAGQVIPLQVGLPLHRTDLPPERKL